MSKHDRFSHSTHTEKTQLKRHIYIPATCIHVKYAYKHYLRCGPSGFFTFYCLSIDHLDKTPGVRPISICETARRIIAKMIFFVTKGGIQEAEVSLQLFVGQCAGAKAVVHAGGIVLKIKHQGHSARGY